MLKKSPRSVTPRAAGVVVLVMAAIAAALVATSAARPHVCRAQRLAAAGTASASGARIVVDVNKAVGSGPIVEPGGVPRPLGAAPHAEADGLPQQRPKVHARRGRGAHRSRPVRAERRSGRPVQGRQRAGALHDRQLRGRRRRTAGGQPATRRPTRTARSARTTTSRSSTPASPSSTRPGRCSTGRADEHALERVRRQAARPTTTATARSSTTSSPTAGSSRSSPSARLRTCSASPSRRRATRPAPSTATRSRTATRVPRLPEDGRLAGRLLRDVQHVRQRPELHGPRGLRVRPGEDAPGPAATQQCFKLGDSLGGLLPAERRRPDAAAGGLAELRHRLRHQQPAAVEVPRRLGDAGELDAVRAARSSPVAAFTPACGGGTCVPQPGTTQKLDSLGDRLMYRLAYRNFGDHESLVVTHSVDRGRRRPAMRWYEIRSPDGTPTVFQQGTYSPDATYRWMGSVAMDQVGDMALGYQRLEQHASARRSATPAGSSATRSARWAGREHARHRHRLADRRPDPLGRLQQHEHRPGRRLHVLVRSAST